MSPFNLLTLFRLIWIQNCLCFCLVLCDRVGLFKAGWNLSSGSGPSPISLELAPLSLSKSVHTFCLTFNDIAYIVFFLFPIEVTRKSLIYMLWIYYTVDLVLKREPDSLSCKSPASKWSLVLWHSETSEWLNQVDGSIDRQNSSLSLVCFFLSE